VTVVERESEAPATGLHPVLRYLEGRADPLADRSQRGFHARRRTRLFAESTLGRRLASTRSHRSIRDWDSLRLRLGSPQTVLCLGNGPTSEDPAVLTVPYDCLIRVNHRWLDRGILTNPDVVFVGSLDTTLRVPACVFAFRNVRKEREILLRHLFFGLRFAQVEHFTVERMASVLDERKWPATITNGAVMVAAAVMLRPRRIVIAGIDLYRDPRGRYPGDDFAENDYMRGHDRNVELEVIELALSRFDGEVTLLSPNLEEELTARRVRASQS
jgi:hypothetical protein